MSDDTPDLPAELVEHKTQTLAPQTINPMQMVAMAVQQGADVDKLAKLMELQERWEAAEAKKAFVRAMAAFKANPPQVVKNKEVAFLDVHYFHATLDQIADAVSKGMSAHGLSFRWNTEQSGNTIRVTCIVTHDLGHSEQVSLEASPDTSGKKNAIQAVGSAVSYLQRYTLCAITGIAAQDMDDDGAGSGKPGYSDEQEDWLYSLRDAALEGMTALTAKFKALVDANPKGNPRKALNDLWEAESRALKNAAAVADNDKKKGGA